MPVVIESRDRYCKHFLLCTPNVAMLPQLAGEYFSNIDRWMYGPETFTKSQRAASGNAM